MGLEVKGSKLAAAFVGSSDIKKRSVKLDVPFLGVDCCL